MDLLLKNKKILVTGGSKGIGLACAKTLALEGARLIVASRSEQNLKQAVEQIGGLSEVYTFPCDISRTEDLEALFEFVTNRFGTPDGLIINSGGPPLGSALEHGDDAWFAAVNSLLMPVVRLTRYFVPGMQERGYGRIISVSSTGVKQPIAGLVLSNSVRSSVVAFLKTLSAEVAKNNIYINSLLPGSTNTERLSSLHETISKKSGRSIDEVINQRKESIPAGRFAEPSSLADFAAFLLSEKNSYITGQSIAVDGGLVTFPL